MHRLSPFVLALLAALPFTPAHAESSVWHPQDLRTDVEIFFSSADIDYVVAAYQPAYQFEHKAYVIGFSRQVTDYFAIDIRYGRGNEDSTPGNMTGIVSQKLTQLAGGYAKLGLPLGQYLEPYMLIGFSSAVREGGHSTFDLNFRDQGVGFGAGLKLKFGETFGLRVESMRYIDKSEVEISGTSVAVSVTFK